MDSYVSLGVVAGMVARARVVLAEGWLCGQEGGGDKEDGGDTRTPHIACTTVTTTIVYDM